MKKSLLLFLLIGIMPSAHADDLRYLTFETITGAAQSIGIVDLNLTFDASNVTANAGEETVSLPLEDLAKMYFSETAVEVNGINDKGVREHGVDVYTIEGLHIGRFANAQTAYSHLSKGLYVVKNNSRTYKMRVR